MEARTENAGPDNTQQILEKRAQELATAMAADGQKAKTITVITFRMGKEIYAAEMALLREVQPLAKLNWSLLPCTPPFMLGLTNLRGRLYSLVDLGVFLGLPRRPISENSHVILVKVDEDNHGKEMSIAVLADSLPMVRLLAVDEFQETGEGISIREREFVQGVTPDMVVLLDMKNLLSDPRMVIDSSQAADDEKLGQ